jgi:hypothetical protein
MWIVALFLGVQQPLKADAGCYTHETSEADVGCCAHETNGGDAGCFPSGCGLFPSLQGLGPAQPLSASAPQILQQLRFFKDSDCSDAESAGPGPASAPTLDPVSEDPGPAPAPARHSEHAASAPLPAPDPGPCDRQADRRHAAAGDGDGARAAAPGRLPAAHLNGPSPSQKPPQLREHGGASPAVPDRSRPYAVAHNPPRADGPKAARGAAAWAGAGSAGGKRAGVSFTAQGPVHVSDSDEAPASARGGYFVRHLEQELESPNKPPDSGRHFAATDALRHDSPAVPPPSAVHIGHKARTTPERGGAAPRSGGRPGDEEDGDDGAEACGRRDHEGDGAMGPVRSLQQSPGRPSMNRGWGDNDGGDLSKGAEAWRRRAQDEMEGDGAAARWRRSAMCNGEEARKSSSRELVVEAVAKVRNRLGAEQCRRGGGQSAQAACAYMAVPVENVRLLHRVHTARA